jgi:hypothetical protein
LTGWTGRFIEDDVFHVDAKEVEAFDRTFPRREPRVHASIEVLGGQLNSDAMSALSGHGVQKLVDLTRFSGSEIASWDGTTGEALPLINAMLAQHGYAERIWP